MPKTSAEYLRVSLALKDLEELEKSFEGVVAAPDRILRFIKKSKEYLEDRKVVISSFRTHRKDGIPR